MRRGFGLIEILLVMGILALLLGAGFYFGRGNGGHALTPQEGNSAEEQARQAVNTFSSSSQAEQNLLNKQ